MSRRPLLLLSAALTAFTLVIAGGTASYVLRTPTGGANADTVPVDVVRAREAKYRSLIEEANDRLRSRPASVIEAPAPPSMSSPFHDDDDDDGEHAEREDDDG